MKKLTLFFVLILNACDSGPFFSEAMCQSMGCKDVEAPNGCTYKRRWENYDCGDFGLGACQRRVDVLICSVDADLKKAVTMADVVELREAQKR